MHGSSIPSDVRELSFFVQKLSLQKQNSTRRPHATITQRNNRPAASSNNPTDILPSFCASSSISINRSPIIKRGATVSNPALPPSSSIHAHRTHALRASERASERERERERERDPRLRIAGNGHGCGHSGRWFGGISTGCGTTGERNQSTSLRESSRASTQYRDSHQHWPQWCVYSLSKTPPICTKNLVLLRELDVVTDLDQRGTSMFVL
jgi:hypothetical protein